MRAETDDDVWTIVVTATGRVFCTGADVDTVRDDGKIPFDGRYLSRFHEWDAPQEATPPFRQMAKPVIVGVNGICCGAGLDLVTTGDIAIASEQAQFFDPHVSIGLVSGREMVRVAAHAAAQRGDAHGDHGPARAAERARVRTSSA